VSTPAATDPLAQRAWHALESVPDPEIPVVSIRELGILREVREHADGSGVEVVITPTYNGCPAMEQITDDVHAALAAHGIAGSVVTQLAPAWTTDWIGPEAREKLRRYGIAPPQPTSCGSAPSTESAAGSAQVLQFAPRRNARAEPIACPLCGSHNTTETSHFGSTACKALMRCLDCLEPFDYFKPY
jgi:ring-1,2-phenylacetyl-CoA epoxidase subunit PaaD